MFHRSDPIDYIQRARSVRKSLFGNGEGAEIERYFGSPLGQSQEDMEPLRLVQEENARSFSANGEMA